ncbi:MAG: hypothetical protein A3I87_03055 [Candidatus Staskawiczbacteria bacterium RIFCSPLOWO2_02_FULL_39_8]|nr:MAG: hypothetical protein A3I87_03055 [Candidatus Staskawiczbacteria bacterium RIFCSPLOWO2_02_FULL_39_8]
MDKTDIKKFQVTIWSFYKANKRNFPWRNTTDPYKILVSAIMLQQTQADRVVAFYERWIKRFPGITSLASAKFSEIYPFWQGLGYNRRALALQKLAKEVASEHQGKLPVDIVLLQQLPGIGPYTAQAISIFSYNRPLTCLETNIRRVFIHHFFPEGDAVTDEEILPLLDLALPAKRSREWHWALMDYGAHLKSTVPNPNRRHKNYSIQSKFEGSVRQIRGSILRNLAGKKMSFSELMKIYPPRNNAESYAEKRGKLKIILDSMEKEELITHDKKNYSLK